MTNKAFRKLLSFLLACLFIFSAAVSASADAWIPPDDEYNSNLLCSCSYEDECRAINVFVSNYVEANITNYYTCFSDEEIAINGTLKHLELNPDVYDDEVQKVTIDGKTCMRIEKSTFERVIYNLYNCSVSATSCPGYDEKEEAIIVSAENYGAPLTVFGSVYGIYYSGNGLYEAFFDVYQSKQGEDCSYSIPNYDLPEDLEYLGFGEIFFNYYGDNEETDFEPSDFWIDNIFVEFEGTVPYTNPNLPVNNSSNINTEPETTETASETVFVATKPGEKTTPEQSSKDTGSNRLMIVLIAAIVVLVAVVAFLVIFIIFRNKKNRQQAVPPQYTQPPQYMQQPQYTQPPQYMQQPQYTQPQQYVQPQQPQQPQQDTQPPQN